MNIITTTDDRAGGFRQAQSRAARLLVATAAAVAVWAVVQLLIDPFLPGDQVVYLLAALAVMVSALVAGPVAGVLTTAVLALVAFYFWEQPYHSFRIGRWQDAATGGLFLALGATISVLAGREARAKRAAQDQGERFRQMLERGPLGVAIIGPDNRVQGANALLCRMLELGPDEIVGRTVESLTRPADAGGGAGNDPGGDAAMVRRLWDGRIPTGCSVTKRYVRHGGDPFWAAVSVAVVRDERGRPAYAVAMVQDVTENKRMEAELERSRVKAEAAREAAEAAREAAEAANRAKDQFLAVLSHELRTPLSPVLLRASSMEADPSLPDPVRDDARVIRQGAELEARLIDDLLDVTGIAQGKLSLRRSRVDVHALIGRALYAVEGEAAGKGLRVRAELDAPRADVEADPTRLLQVLWNLLRNAVKFTPAGGEVVVRTACEPPGGAGAAGAQLVIEVRDTGRGIAADVLPRLFRAFEQGPPGAARQFGGLGLGLAISRSIVELHGGRIEAASAGPGRGATFTVRVPMADPVCDAAASDGRRPTAPPPPAARAARGLRVLLVEDDPETRRALRSIVASLGHEVRAAGTLAEALALAAGGTFDLLISDLALPDGSGHDLMSQLKRRQHDLHGVAVSGFGMADDVRRSREAGFDEHLTKPVSLEQIREAVGHAVGA